MSILFAISLTTGLLSALWGWVAVSLGLLSWAGFLGCTTYFASPVQSVKGLLLSMLTNMTGVFWAMVIIKGSQWVHFEILGYVVTALVAFFMCIQAKHSWLTFIPGTFIGSCATFAGNADLKLIVPSLLVGAVFGYLMKATGVWLYERQKKEAMPSEPQKAE